MIYLMKMLVTVVVAVVYKLNLRRVIDMLSIDEAISIERNLAEIYRNDIVPKEDYHNMPWIDIVNEGNNKAAEEHEQLAEWLQELKAYREKKCNKSVYLSSKSIDKIDAVNKGYADGYNKAIDDFIHECDKHCEFYSGKNISLTREDILKIAEQLKERE